MGTPGSNVRATPRIPVHLAVRFTSGAQLRECFIESLSGGGVFIRTRMPLPIGSDVDMEILLDEEADPVCIHGRVVWDRLYLDPEGTEAPHEGMGVRFTEPLPARLAALLQRAPG